MPATVDRDRTAFAGHAPARTRMVTTLYDLITTLHESSETGEEDLVTASGSGGCFTGVDFLPCVGCVEGGHDESALPPLSCLWESRSHTGSTLVKHLQLDNARHHALAA